MALAVIGAALVGLPADAQGNPAARRTTAGFSLLAGRWNGAHLEQRSNCSTAENNGFHATYSDYFFSYDRANAALGIDENTLSGLACVYTGQAADDWLRPQWTGAFNCNDGRRGTFQAQSFLITPTAMSVRLTMKLSFTETCDVDAILGGSRF
jgi:hypothetical protein